MLYDRPATIRRGFRIILLFFLFYGMSLWLIKAI